MSYEGKDAEAKDSANEDAVKGGSGGGAISSEGKESSEGDRVIELDTSQFSRDSRPQPNLVQKLLEYFCESSL